MHEPYSFNKLTRKGGNARSFIKHRGGNNNKVVHYYLLLITRVLKGNCVKSRNIVYKRFIEMNILIT
jgi:hypothetical protein